MRRRKREGGRGEDRERRRRRGEKGGTGKESRRLEGKSDGRYYYCIDNDNTFILFHCDMYE